jgi:hypothetical protein
MFLQVLCTFLVHVLNMHVFLRFNRFREFLDKVQCEIDRQQPSVSNGIKCHGVGGVSSPKDGGDDVITLLFQGELVSQVNSQWVPVFQFCNSSIFRF